MPNRPNRPHGSRRAALSACLFLYSGAAEAQDFAVDEQAAEQAIERALVQTGSVLLPPRTIEVVPSFGFERNEDEVAGLPVLVNGELIGSSIRLERNEIAGGFTLRAGLPWSGQVDLTVPFAHVNRDDERRVLGATVQTSSASLSGLGDVRLAYTQQFRSDTGGMPSLLGTVIWDSDTGGDENGLFLGSGFNEIGVVLTATQRQDPIVFSARLGYQWALEDGGVQPGDQFSFSTGAFLALNPETSLQFGFSAAYADDAKVNGANVAGSDQLAAALDLGMATILRRNTLLNATLSIGMTEDAPDLAVAVNMPLRLAY